MAKALVVLIAVALGACGQQSSSERPDWMNPKWQELPDGSHFTEVSDDNGNRVANRCWPEIEGGFLCLAAGRLAAMGAVSIAVEHEGALPDMVEPSVSAFNGYSCGTVLGPREYIKKGGDTLISNEPRNRDARWSPNYVARYLADNEIKGTGHFQCLEVLDAVLKGSLATLGSTSVTSAMAAPVGQ